MLVTMSWLASASSIDAVAEGARLLPPPSPAPVPRRDADARLGARRAPHEPPARDRAGGGADRDGVTFNSNADVVAGKIAEILKAEKLIMMTNIAGVQDKQGNLVTDLSAREIDEMFADGTISGGMLPKISSALDAAKSGVNS